MAERRNDPCHPVVLPALCRLDERVEFHAVTVNLSAAGIRLRSAAIPSVGMRLDCNIRGVGPIKTRVGATSTCDFAVKVTGGDLTPGEVARRLIDLSKRQGNTSQTVRLDRRIVPAQTAVQITLADGRSVPATILNLSVSGVALRTDAELVVGQPITVGTRDAVVARQIDDGVGVAFIEAFASGTVTAQTVL